MIPLIKKLLLLLIPMLWVCCNEQYPYDELIVYSENSGAFSFTIKCFIIDFKEKAVFYTLTMPNERLLLRGERRDSVIIKKASLNNHIINTIKQKAKAIKISGVVKNEVMVSETPYLNLIAIKNNLISWQIDYPTYIMPSEFDDILQIMNKLSFKEQFNSPLLNAIKIDKVKPVAFDPLNDKHNIPIYSIKFTAFINYLCRANVVKNNANLKGQLICIFPNAIAPTYVPTDGRYYAFPTETGDTITLDIGFNFLETIMKEEYDNWNNKSSN